MAQKVIIPSSVTEIQKEAFKGWENLREIVFDDDSHIQKIGVGAFSETSLEAFTAPKSLREIG